VRATPLVELAAMLRTAPVERGDVAVSGVTLSSGSVLPGDLYAALPGSRAHGAQYAAQAAAAGAVALLTDPAGADRCAATGLPVLVVDDPRAVLGAVSAVVYGHPTARLRIIGITGTAGKTSTVHLIEAGLRAAGLVTGLIGTVETRLGELSLDSTRTTPEATDLQALFAVALEHGVEAVAMEVSSHALELGRVGGVEFAVGGFTNLGLDHLDFHPDVEAYFAAKAKLFDGRSKIEIVNLDDPAGRRLRKPGTLTFSAAGEKSATWFADGVRTEGYEQRFTAHGPDGIEVAAGVRLPGRHNVANALLAIASLVAAGVDPVTAAAAVAASGGAPGRMERVDPPDLAGGGVLGIVDYAHKPDAIVEVLGALRGLVAGAGGRVICVLGAGGDRDTGKRPLMGAAAARGADLVIVTDDNPRTEDPAAVRRDVLSGAADAGPAEVAEIAGRRAAIAEAVRRARPGDVVALLGKGHERGQEVGGQVHPFDDRVELADALRQRFATGAPVTT
jgi:UDP-N-acetylmuramoyl-L-alanyl-D-glutamate--2,6-diaminopimelate ligase